MNCMTDVWSVFGRDNGQIVERAYRYHETSDTIVRRTRDRSEGSVEYHRAPCPEELEWNGSEAAVGGVVALDWEPCQNPFTD